MRSFTLWFHIVAQLRERMVSRCLDTSESIHFVAQRRKRIGFLVVWTLVKVWGVVDYFTRVYENCSGAIYQIPSLFYLLLGFGSKIN